MTTFQVVREFRAAPGARFSDEKAQVYGEFLESKVGLGKRVVPSEEIVKAARPKRSPLHGEFIWDVEQAAHEHRLHQARELVNHIVVTTSVGDGDRVTETRAFHNVTAPANGEGTVRGYVAARMVWQRPELAEQVVSKALAELRSWQERYDTYSELASVVEKVAEILEDEAA